MGVAGRVMSDDSSSQVPADGAGLRAYTDGLLALSTIPERWSGTSVHSTAEGVCDLLVHMLRADAAYIRLHAEGAEPPVLAAGGSRAAEVERAIQEAEPGGRTMLRRLHDAKPALWLVSLPLGDGEELGCVGAGSSRPEFPTETESLLLRIAAHQLTNALRQAALLRSRAERDRLLSVRAAQQAAIMELGLRSLCGIPVGTLIREALAVVGNTLHADLGELLELAPYDDSLLLTAGLGWRAGVVGQAKVAGGSGSHAGYTLQVRAPVVIEDLRQEARFTPPALLLEHGMVSGITVVVHDERQPYGVLGAHSRARRHFTWDDAHFLQSVANLLAIALQRHRSETEREELLRQMGRAIAARDRAVGIVSHDLSNPLSTIQICATALRDPDPPTASGVRHMAEIIQRSTAWMQQIVQDLLDRASLDAGRLVLDRKPTVAADVISAAQVIFAPVAAEHELEFVVESDPSLPPIYADSHRLLQVLSNLLSNAIKFTPAGGRVVVSARREPQIEDARGPNPGGGVRFQVSDTGLGIAPEDLAHVFDWFWHSGRAGQKGTGLGLAIAGGLVEAHQGRLKVESAPGRGSTFWFTMPAARTTT